MKQKRSTISKTLTLKLGCFLFISLLYIDTTNGRNIYDYSGKGLALPIGARAVGIGGAFSANTYDVYALFCNPAGLGFLKENMFTCSCSEMPYDNNNGKEGCVAVGVPIKQGSLGIGYTFNSLGDFEAYWAGIGFLIGNKLSLGVATKVILKVIESGGPSMTVDIGGAYKPIFDKLSLSFGATNLTTDNSISTTLLYGGIALFLPSEKNKKLILSMDIEAPPSNLSILKDFDGEAPRQFGIEYLVTKYLTVRTGVAYQGRSICAFNYYDDDEYNDKHIDSSVALGLGVMPTEKIKIDFASQYLSSQNHKYALSVNFIL